MEKATIFIPDISGFTEFISQTEIEHSAHIIIELMESLIAVNELGFYLSEVEGDALLYYRMGDPPGSATMTAQCLRMFNCFHQRLQLIERDTFCQCGACQTASNLSLKFIVHFGHIHEINIARFTKASGVAMIVAHRLLKNQVPGDEYILFSQDYLSEAGKKENPDNLEWVTASDAYAAVGPVNYEYALLENIRQSIPPPPQEKTADLEVVKANDQTISVEVNAPLLTVYQTLIDVEKRILWVSGMKKMERDKVTERAGMKHVCFTSGFRLEHTMIKTEMTDQEIRYYEKVKVKELLLEVMDLYELKSLGENKTLLELTISITKNFLVPKFIFNSIVKGLKTDLENLKLLCEKEYVLESTAISRDVRTL